MSRTETCNVCRGEGIVDDDIVTSVCDHCDGNGYTSVDVSNDEMAAALEADGEKLRQLTGVDHGPLTLEDIAGIDLTDTTPAPGRMANQTWRILEEQRLAAEETIRECDIEIERWSRKKADAEKTKRMAEAGQAVLDGAV